MACYNPLTGYRSRIANKNGLHEIVFNVNEGFRDRPVVIPCGKCEGCKLEYSRQWAIRCMNEAALHDDNCFITLTYDDKNIPENGSLNKKHFQDFMKRLRKRYADKEIRYFHCGEYGSKFSRPHYHALLFGIDFLNEECVVGVNGSIWSSGILSELWKYGFNTVGRLTFESCAYVARYAMKKIFSEKSVDHYQKINYNSGVVTDILPEYVTMSRRPGIGFNFYRKYKNEIIGQDSVIMRGKEMKPPKYYDEKLKQDNIALYKVMKLKRINELSDRQKEDMRDLDKLRTKEKEQKLLLKNKLRGYEND